MALTSTEDHVFFVTENNQLLKFNLSFEKPDSSSKAPVKFEYVICNFHS
jgi:hypothetical protein